MSRGSVLSGESSFEFADGLRGDDCFDVPVICGDFTDGGYRLHRIRFARRDGGWLVECCDHPEPEAHLAARAFSKSREPLCIDSVGQLLAFIEHAADRRPKLKPWVAGESFACADWWGMNGGRSFGYPTLLTRAAAMQRSGFRPWAWTVVDEEGTDIIDLIKRGLTPDELGAWHRLTGPYFGQATKDKRLGECIRAWARLGVLDPEDARPWTDAGVGGFDVIDVGYESTTLENVPMRLRNGSVGRLGPQDEDVLNAFGVTDEMITSSGLSRRLYVDWHGQAGGHDEVLALRALGVVRLATGFSAADGVAFYADIAQLGTRVSSSW